MSAAKEHATLRQRVMSRLSPHNSGIEECFVLIKELCNYQTPRQQKQQIFVENGRKGSQ
jgi:hypothetical protein